ncbi:GGDEF domain-containing protein [Buttiauxella sp. 3AFRM03]|uniref:diguanylate cyclase n=1 Tax=Buttiauxella sp. 3AFRM03 TaxID=2479367 RepID=UPI000EF78DEB|nr:diguanylate cyclase [Buttiauxella sp. 3AFRM03]AYN25792.1 GGDEF domain-containing protein [Buttiauxella sp. 3AFRM03]
MNVFATSLTSYLSRVLSNLGEKRWVLVLVMLIQAGGLVIYLYLSHNWIESGVVQSLRNVSSMHLRGFEQLERTISYQLASVGEAVADDAQFRYAKEYIRGEVEQTGLDSIIVLDRTGKIIASESVVPLELILPPSVFATQSFRDLPQFKTFQRGGTNSTFFVSRQYVPEMGGNGMIMYHMMTSPEGRPLGSVIGYTSLRSLSMLLYADTARGFDLGKNGVLSIFDNHTRQVLYRYAYSRVPVEEHSLALPAIRDRYFQNTRYGPDVKYYQSPVDGVERLVVLTPLHLGQWMQLVGESPNEYLFEWRIQVAISVFVFICVSFLQVLLMDIFRQNKAQRTLLDLVLNSVDACVYLKTSDRRFSYVNSKTAELFGLPVEQIIGRRDKDILPQKLVDDFWATDKQVLETGNRQLCTEMMINPQGERRYFSTIKELVRIPDQLPAVIGLSTDVTELHEQTEARKAAEDAIRKMAFFDQLTGLPNRRMLEERLGKTLAQAKLKQQKLSLLFIDLDKFKAVNDLHGHKTGDWLLTQAASRMSSVLRASDIVSRIGGDEFVVLLPDAQSLDEAVRVAERIRALLEQPFVMDNGVALDISSSIGVVIYPDLADNVHDLLHFADEAMYRAKKGGKNAVEVFTG